MVRSLAGRQRQARQVFFFEKKQQDTLVHFGFGVSRRGSARFRKRFLLLFFKKEGLPSCMTKLMIAVGALAGFTGVAMAAVAQHALPQRLDARGLELVNVAIQMQMWHALALVFTGVWCRGAPPATLGLAKLAGAAFMLGLLLFCGAVYCLGLAGIQLGPAAPIGGTLLMAGWVLLAVSALRSGPLP
jgi:uncharacterized membrane protein YgdD (TMEM256/DUF423 family)